MPKPTTRLPVMSDDLSAVQRKFLRSLTKEDKTVRQVMQEQDISCRTLANWMATKTFQRHLAREQNYADLLQRIERSRSRYHATETLARIARGQKVGDNTRLSLQAAIHVIKKSGRKKPAAPKPVTPLVSHDAPATRELLDALNDKPEARQPVPVAKDLDP